MRRQKPTSADLSEYIYNRNVSERFLLSVNKENYPRTRQKSWQHLCRALIQKKPRDQDAHITPATYEVPTNALIVHAHWIDLILDDTKTWDIRSQNTTKRERIAVATTEPYVLLGDVELVNKTHITEDEFKSHVHTHCVDDSPQAAVI